MYRLILVIAFALCAHAQNSGFRENPKNVSQRIGSTAILRCAGFPSGTEHDLHSQWKSNTGSLLGFRHSGTLPGHGGRYSYIRDSPEELHLKIDDVQLEDDGLYECQMVRPKVGQMRASASINVIVSPEFIQFSHYKADTVLELQESEALNITCVSDSAKPVPKMSWYLNGKLIDGSVNTLHEENENKTIVAKTTITILPTKSEHNKVLTCESLHNETGTRLRTSVTLHVLYSSERPKIDAIGGSDGISAGQNVTLVCTTKGGNPPPNLTWFLNNRPIATMYSYDFSNQITRNEYSFVAEGSDNGAVYECRSSNRVNVPPLRKSITLTVKYPPSNAFIYGSSAIHRGDKISLSCLSNPSNPPSMIAWTINDSPLRPQPQSEKRMTAGTATESNITIDSNAVFGGQKEVVIVCLATNEEGSAKQSHTVRILIPPEQPFIYAAENGPLLEGDMLNLTCEATGGNPPAQLTWFRGLEKIRGAQAGISGDTSHSTVSVKLDRSMNTLPIRCEAANDAVEEPLVATKNINVLFPPRRIVLRPPENDRRQMTNGEPARLTCTVPSSNPPAEITWTFDGFEANSRHYTLSYNRTDKSQEFGGFEVQQVITFTASKRLDGSSVHCVANHPLWNDAVTAEYKLSIFYPPQIEVTQPLVVEVDEGSSFEKNLSVTANPPISSWQWRKNGTPFTGTIGSIYARHSVIGGRSVGAADSGVYTVLASNLLGTANVTMKVTVRYAARIVYITSPIIANVGEDVVLECEAEGVPRVAQMIKWMRGNSVLQSVIRDQKRAVLRLNASHETSGAYTCVADNGIGSPNHTTAYLLVKKPPRILRSPTLGRAAGPVGGRAKVICQAVGVPDASFEWAIEGEGNVIQYNNTKYLVHETQLDYMTYQSTLWIMELNEMDYSRRVRCRAANQLGHDIAYITISTPSAPDVPTGLEVLKVTNRSVTLGWMPGFDGGGEQIFELRFQAEGSKVARAMNFTHYQAVITDLLPEHVYFAQIRAINDLKYSSEFSLPPLEIRTLTHDGRVALFGSSLTSEIFSSWALYVAIVIIVLLCCCNALTAFIVRWRRQRKKLHEATEYARTTLINSTDSGTRPIHTYGAVTGTPMTKRRPDSSNTNKTEFISDRASEDDQSVRTMIEVSGYTQRYDPSCIIDYDFNPELYACLNRGTINNAGVTYAAMPYPEPPHAKNQYTWKGDGYIALENTMEPFSSIYGDQSNDVIIGGPSGMSTLRHGSLTNVTNNNNVLHRRHESPALSTFIPHGGLRADQLGMNGDLV